MEKNLSEYIMRDRKDSDQRSTFWYESLLSANRKKAVVKILKKNNNKKLAKCSAMSIWNDHIFSQKLDTLDLVNTIVHKFNNDA